MRKKNTLFVLMLIVVFTLSILAGCTPTPARRVAPNPNPVLPNPAVPQNLQGTRTVPPAPVVPYVPNNPYNNYAYNNNMYNNRTNNANPVAMNRISATFEMVNFSYVIPTRAGVAIKSGLSNYTTTLATVGAGTRLRCVGKIDGWFVVRVPNSTRLGCVATNLVTPYGADNAPLPTPGGPVAPPVTPAPAPTPGTTPAPAPKPMPGPITTMSADESRIVQLTNAERAKTGAAALRVNSDLTRLARMKSQDMVRLNYFSHQSPTYGSPFDMMKANGITYMYAGENIANYPSADGAMQGWMNSPGHRANILNPNFTEIGVGGAAKGNGNSIYTQEFIGR